MLKPIPYHHEGHELTGYLADGSRGSPAPAVIVAHEAAGLDENAKQRAERLAERGWVAMAMDLYGSPFSFDTAGERHNHVMGTPGLMRARARAALETLAGRPNVAADKIAAIGFCQGGVVALELARDRAPIRAAIGFHPGLKRPAGSTSDSIDARVLMMIGDADPVVPPEDRQAFADEMTGSGADWQLHVFGGVGHSFTNPAVDAPGIPGFGHHALADKRSWRMATDLLEEVFAA